MNFCSTSILKWNVHIRKLFYSNSIDNVVTPPEAKTPPYDDSMVTPPYDDFMVTPPKESAFMEDDESIPPSMTNLEESEKIGMRGN